MTTFYILAQRFSYFYFKFFHRFEVLGLENIPRDGPFILASNHLSFFDPPALGCKMPRNLHYFARNTLFVGPLGKLIRNLNSIPVNRDQLDLKTLRSVLGVLKNGHPLLVFPEGTRSKDGKLAKGQKGIGLLIAKSKVPVLPARIQGSHEVLGAGTIFPRFGRKLRVEYGKVCPYHSIDSDPGEDDRYQKISQRIMDAIEQIAID
jgi:1-acyl-sn-glycerol-3-phosphate acyltransferase